jgi:transcription elongation GreA/GreB family factor
MTVTVKLNDEELQFLIVHAGGDGKERLSLKAPLARLLGGMAVGDTLTWRISVPDGELMRVELVKVEEATE